MKSDDAVFFNNISYNFKDKNVLSALNLRIPQGSIFGLLGLNGAGKTTIIKLLTGLYFPTSGTITMFGRVINAQNISDLKKYTGSLIEEASLYDHLTAFQNLKLASQMYGLNYENIDFLLKTVELFEVKDKKINTFSLGMRQRLGIAMALVPNPKLLILDEPMNGLDPLGIVDFRNFIKKLKAELGLTVIFSSHNLHEVELMATNIAILSNKHISFESILPLQNTGNTIIILKTNIANSEQARSILMGNNFKIIKEIQEEFEIEFQIECGLEMTIRDIVHITEPINWIHLSVKKMDIEDMFLKNI